MKRAELLESLDIGSVVKRLREEKGMSQEQLAKGICDRTNITKLENGHYKVPSLSFVLLICDKLEIDLNEFLNIALKDISKLDHHLLMDFLLNDNIDELQFYLRSINNEQLSTKDERYYNFLIGIIDLYNNEIGNAKDNFNKAIRKDDHTDLISLFVINKLKANNNSLDNVILTKKIDNAPIELLYLYNERFKHYLGSDTIKAKVYLEKEIEFINKHNLYRYLLVYYRNKLNLLEKENKDTKDIENKIKVITQKN